jgi:hypothetical protein
VPSSSVSKDSVSELARLSRSWLTAPERARLLVTPISSPGRLLGAFGLREALLAADAEPFERRGSGGPTWLANVGSVYMNLTLAHPGALTPANAGQLLNRYLRPLLSALSSLSGASQKPMKAAYFGRDWLSMGSSVIAAVGFAHHATTRRCMIEALVPLEGSAFIGPRASFRGRAPKGLCELLGSLQPEAVAERIEASYERAYGAIERAGPPRTPTGTSDDAESDVGTVICTEETAIGTLGVSEHPNGQLKLHGDFMASCDAVAALEGLATVSGDGSNADSSAREAKLERRRSELLLEADEWTDSGAIAFGVPSLQSLAEAIASAARHRPCRPH